MNRHIKTSTPEERHAYCAEHGHSWIATTLRSTLRRCSWCGMPEIIHLARQEREAGEQAKARIQQAGEP